MLYLVVLIFIIPWYFKSANSIGANPWLWSILSFFIYIIPVALWGALVIPLLRSSMSVDSNLTAVLFGAGLAISSIIIGLISVLIFHAIFLREFDHNLDDLS